ncbi:MAG: prepilin-type N-terminal cleavage/methylation domain-containing protein [Burkholderiales bacterium]|nr:prepilin-type N-terminal cleavage/methylation domain-containing protein [Burkholderiales bacterium]
MTAPTRRQGFTLLELAFVMAVLAIILAAAVPSYAGYLARQRLRHVAELLEMDLRRARALSVQEGRNTYVSFQSGPQWCWGASRQSPCDCATGLPRCELGGINYREHKGMLLQSPAAGLRQRRTQERQLLTTRRPARQICMFMISE